jgi:adenylate cyclase
MLDRASRDVGINTLVAFDRAQSVARFLSEAFPAVLPAQEVAVPKSLQALINAEAAATETARQDVWKRIERRLALREHADWMQERIGIWRKKAVPLLEAARAKKKIDVADADAAQAALDEADAILSQFVDPHREQEVTIRKEFGERIRGAVCIVGAGGTGHDVHATPLDQSFPGPWVVSNVINMFLTKRFLRETSEPVNVLILLGCALIVGYLVSSAGPLGSAAGVLVAEAGWAALVYALFTIRGRVVDAAGPAMAMFLVYAFVTAYRQLVEGRGKRQIRQIFGLFVNDQVLGELMRDPKAIALGGQKRVVTVFFSDIAGFTALSEKLDPAEQIRFVNDYLTAMSDAIMREGGYINKYIGDGIMALFGAPLEKPAHTEDAARAASGCLEALDRFNASLAARGKPPLRIRIGLSTGEVVVGLVGALGKKLEYTAMGDVVNLAARLEAASKQYETIVLMNETCLAGCRESVVARDVDRFRVPGKAVPVQAFELLGMKAGTIRVPDGFLDAYGEGVALYRTSRWESAEAAFRRALALRPEDGPSRIYLERCAQFREEPPPEGWDGVADVTVK